MTRLDFYFDPLCPWAWLTSLWAREVRDHRSIEVEWKFFSLGAINELDPYTYGPLRACALARRDGGNDAVDRAYLAFGRMFHEHRQRAQNEEELVQFSREHLADVGLDPDLVSSASNLSAAEVKGRPVISAMVAAKRSAKPRLALSPVPTAVPPWASG